MGRKKLQVTPGADVEVPVATSEPVAKDEFEAIINPKVEEARVEADSLVILEDADYQKAAELIRKVKGLQKQVKEYWEPLRQEAYRPYEAILDRRKKMYDPLDGIERTLKGKMGDYTRRLQEQRRREEEKYRADALAEAERKRAEAEKARLAGDEEAAMYADMEAQILDNAAQMGTVPGRSAPKADGVTATRKWTVVSVDPARVPIMFSGTEIRPVDMSAVNRLIKESKGTIQIPGIVYREETGFIVRS